MRKSLDNKNDSDNKNNNEDDDAFKLDEGDLDDLLI